MCDGQRKSSHPTLHENYNEQELESVVVEKSPSIVISPLARSADSASSISSSSSSRRSHTDSTGELTDNESEGDDEADSKPLLARLSLETGRVGKSLIPTKTNTETSQKPVYSLNRQSDAVINFSCIWFNCASPSSVKPVPDTYHLHNNLLTTGIPAVSSWMPGIEKVRSAVSQLQHNQRHRYYLVTASIMAQGLPDKILCTVSLL